MLFGYSMSVLMILIIIISFFSLFYCSSGKRYSGNNRFLNYILVKEEFQGCHPTKQDFFRIALIALGFRLVSFVISAMIMRSYINDGELVSFERFLYEWIKWDSSHYIEIAEKGYSGIKNEGMYTNLVFFPVYPILIKAFRIVISDTSIAALLVSVICYVIGVCYLYGAICLDYGDSIAKRTVLYLSIFPFSFYYGSIMSESTFLMMCAIVFYYVKKHNWVLGGLFGLLASLSRIQGVLTVVVFGCEWLEHYKTIKKLKEKSIKLVIKELFTSLVWALLIPAGVVIYLLLNYKVAGNPFAFLEYEEKVWFNGGKFFGQTIGDVWNRSFRGEMSGQLKVIAGYIPLFLICLTLILLIYSIKHLHNKYIFFYLFYTMTCYSHGWLISAGRYMSAAFPMFIVLSIIAEKHKEIDKWIIISNSILYGVILYEFLTLKNIY